MAHRSQQTAAWRRVATATATVTSLALVAAACGSSDSPRATGSSSTASTTTAATTSSTTTVVTTTVPATTLPASTVLAPTTTPPPATTSPSTTPTAPTEPPTTATPSTPPAPSTSLATGTASVRLPGAHVASISWPTPDQAWAIADHDDGSRTLLHTTDGGTTWSSASAPDVSGAAQVLFADATDGWIAGERGLQSTHDGGATWQPATLPGGVATAAALAAAGGTVHVAYIRTASDGIGVASSPVDHDAFVASPLRLPFAAGPLLDVTMSAGGSYGELIYMDRTFSGAAEIRDGQWTSWDLHCPVANPTVAAGLSPHGSALSIGCGPSGFGDGGPVLGADLSGGSLQWATIVPAGPADQGPSTVRFAMALDGGARIVVESDPTGAMTIATSTDGGAAWPARTAVPAGTIVSAWTHLPDGSVLLVLDGGGGMVSTDGVTWTAVPTAG